MVVQTQVFCSSVCVCVCVCVLSHSVISNSVTPWTVACQAPLSMGFPRQEYWSGVSFPSPVVLKIYSGPAPPNLSEMQVLRPHRRPLGEGLGNLISTSPVGDCDAR